MFKECEKEEHKALEKEGLKVCPRCGLKTRTVIPWGIFREKRKKKKYGCNKKKLMGMGFSDDFIFGPDER